MIISRPTNTLPARIKRFADADTVVIQLDIGFGISVEKYIRLEGIESWELNGPDRERAISARDALDSLLRDRVCLVHLRGKGHDKYARLRGSVTVGDVDLATRIVELGYAFHCSAKASAALHAERTAAISTIGALTAGCYTSRDASTLILQSGTGSGTASNGTRAVTQSIEAAQHASATTSTHAVLWTLGGLALAALIAAIIWLVHNRGKLAGLVATAATKV